MANTIELSQEEWQNIKSKIQEEYGPNILLISWKLKRTLGFTLRHHQTYVDDGDYGSGWVTKCMLDFYDDELETVFRLKYL